MSVNYNNEYLYIMCLQNMYSMKNKDGCCKLSNIVNFLVKSYFATTICYCKCYNSTIICITK